MKTKKIKKKKFLGQLNYEDYILSLRNTIENLEKQIDLHLYFKSLKRKRNSYIVEMRRLVTLDLEQQGYNVSDIARILSRHHSSIIYIKNTLPSQEVGEIVSNNYQQWIADKVHPVAYLRLETSAIHPTGTKHVTTFKLQSL